jgi:hypothetical protein
LYPLLFRTVTSPAALSSPKLSLIEVRVKKHLKHLFKPTRLRPRQMSRFLPGLPRVQESMGSSSHFPSIPIAPNQ